MTQPMIHLITEVKKDCLFLPIASVLGGDNRRFFLRADPLWLSGLCVSSGLPAHGQASLQ